TVLVEPSDQLPFLTCELYGVVRQLRDWGRGRGRPTFVKTLALKFFKGSRFTQAVNFVGRTTNARPILCACVLNRECRRHTQCGNCKQPNCGAHVQLQLLITERKNFRPSVAAVMTSEEGSFCLASRNSR